MTVFSTFLQHTHCSKWHFIFVVFTGSEIINKRIKLKLTLHFWFWHTMLQYFDLKKLYKDKMISWYFPLIFRSLDISDQHTFINTHITKYARSVKCLKFASVPFFKSYLAVCQELRLMNDPIGNLNQRNNSKRICGLALHTVRNKHQFWHRFTIVH